MKLYFITYCVIIASIVYIGLHTFADYYYRAYDNNVRYLNNKVDELCNILDY